MYSLDISKPSSKVAMITCCVPSEKEMIIVILSFFISIVSSFDFSGIFIKDGKVVFLFWMLGSKKNTLNIMVVIIIIPKIITIVSVYTSILRRFSFT